MNPEEKDRENLRREAGGDLRRRLDDVVIQVAFARYCLSLTTGNHFSLAHLEDDEMQRASREHQPELSRLEFR